MESFKSLSAMLDKAEHCPIGQSDDRIHSTDDPGCTYLAEDAVDQSRRKNLTKGHEVPRQNPEARR